MRISDEKIQVVLSKARILRSMYLNGALGGEVMPEDANPSLPKDSAMNYLYFTLPMALNYQRNSYTLWQSALSTYNDQDTNIVFNPEIVAELKEEHLRALLLKYRLALQPNKHCEIWKRLSHTILQHFEGDIRNLFIECNWEVTTLLEYIQKRHKRAFPYLCGPKIGNYWLYVMNHYTDAKLIDTDALSIAPDTHVVQASIRLGVVTGDEASTSQLASKVNLAWKSILKGSDLSLIDLHTPLWLWSRNGFQELDFEMKSEYK